MKKIIALVIVAVIINLSAGFVSADNNTDPSGNVWIRSNFGAGEANYYIEQLAKGDVSMVQYTMDRYYLFPSSEGLAFRWGNGWLNKAISYMLALRAYEMRSELTETQMGQLDVILADTVREETFRLDQCGVSSWNSCSEDFASMFALIAAVRNLYPQAVIMAGGDAKLLQLEKKYFELTFTTNNGNYSLVNDISAIDGRTYTMVRNHGEQSAVYSNVLFVGIANALYTYWMSHSVVPDFYKAEPIASNIKSMFHWVQTTSLSDGTGFVVGCKACDGKTVSCADVLIANTVPTYLPGGRPIFALFGESAFTSGLYDFRSFDGSYTGGNSSAGRVLSYGVYNVNAIDVGLSSSVVPPDSMEVSWNSGINGLYDVWGPDGYASTSIGSGAVIEVDPTKDFRYGVVIRSGGRILGVEFDSYTAPRQIRRRLHRVTAPKVELVSTTPACGATISFLSDDVVLKVAYTTDRNSYVKVNFFTASGSYFPTQQTITDLVPGSGTVDVRVIGFMEAVTTSINIGLTTWQSLPGERFASSTANCTFVWQ